MKKSLIQEWKMSLCDLRAYLIMETVIFVLGTLFMSFMQVIGRVDEIFALGSTMALLLMVFILLFGNVAGFDLYFNMAVQMGAVRKRLIPSTLIVYFARTGILFLLTRIFMVIEKWLYQWIFSGSTYKNLDNRLLSGPWLLVWACLITGLGIVGSGIRRKCGKWGNWVLMFVWMVICWSIPSTMSQNNGGNIFLRFSSFLGSYVELLSPVMQMSLVFGLGLLLCVIGYLILKKEEVR